MLKSFVVATLTLVFGALPAQGSPIEIIKATLTERFPTVQIVDVSETRWMGLYEVVTADEIVYTNADGSFLISGSLLDTKTHENLTRARWNALHAIAFNELPFELAIKTVRGDGSRKLAVFADPDCPYCQQFEQTLKGIDNITVYTFLYPLEGVHPEARTKAVRIWCTKDKAGAWTAWMLQHLEPAEATCKDEPTATLIELGGKLKVEATPTLFFQDGHRVPGMLGAEQLEQELRASSGRVALKPSH
ncbi:MAG TPA: DsbC family protein [Paraburkholderia sp.]|uniref:DsbC family protein n=1 Tax=Paraburkholderia sp. TaxID=1926495 RepID=UPI002B46ADBE|nr:DsbC family protein [Paraburkholderia sp.]HKR46167.1 DsbC family protein [Paraburkholderia sp.]